MPLRVSLPLALACIVAYTLAVHGVFWHLPLVDLGALQTEIQDERFSDPNFYLWVAARVCRQDSWTLEDLTVTWSSAGVVGFLALGCRTLGSEYFYILANPLLAALALAVFVRTARTAGLQPDIRLASVFALPYTLLTLSLPGKEIISILGSLLVASGLLLATLRVRPWRAAALVLVGLLVVASSRAHEAIAIALFVVLWLSRSMSSVWRLALILLLTAQAAPILLSYFQLDSVAGSLTDEALWSGSSEGKALDYDGLFDRLRSDNLVLHALLGVARVAVVIAAPATSLVSPWTDADLSYFVFRDLSQRLRLVDLAFIVYVAVLLVRGARRPPPAGQPPRLRWLLPAFFFSMVYVIVFFGVSQKSRYVFQYTPLLLLWLWCFRAPSAAAPATTARGALAPRSA